MPFVSLGPTASTADEWRLRRSEQPVGDLMPTTDQDLRALTYLARRLRDETHGCAQWDEAGTYACLKDALAGQNLLIAAQRVLGHATDPQAKTPGAIKRPFTPEPTNAPARVPFDPRAVCHICNLTEGRHDGQDHPFLSVEAKRAIRSSPVPRELRDAIAPSPRTWPAPAVVVVPDPTTTPTPDERNPQ